MAIETPVQRPELLKQLETDFGSTTSKYIWRKVMLWQLWMSRSIPVGSIISFFGSTTFANGDPLVGAKENYWQWCNGSAISNASSPLNGQTIPDFREKFLKGSSTIGSLGGQSTINLLHQHSGFTGLENQVGGNGGDNGGDETAGTVHNHPIDIELSSVENVIPPYSEVQYYMRVDGGANQAGGSLSTNIGDLIDNDVSEFAKIFSQDFATLLYNNNIWFDALIPLGMVVPIMTNIPGVPAPDSNIWQECNGSEIVNENSPLRSVGASQYYTPNLIDSYVRVPSVFGLAGQVGGVNQFDFTHNHSGFTHDFESPAGMDHGGVDRAVDRHRHTFETDLAIFNTEPPYYTVKFFIRIN
jgi:hypothetical protein